MSALPAKDTVSIVLDLMNERYELSSYCYFYGSHSINTAKPNSDVDLIFVYEQSIEAYREKFMYEGLLMDVFVYDEETLNGSLHMARMNGKFGSADALITARTLPAPTAASEKLRATASRIRKAGYIFQNRAYVRQYITNILDDLEANPASAERNMLCVDLFKSTTDLILIGGGAGMCDRKHAAQELTGIDAEMHQRLDAGLIRALSGDVTELAASARKVLSQIGGPLREGFKQGFPNPIRMPFR